MSTATSVPAKGKPIIYPDSDGQPMAENTLQFQWIVTIKENLEVVFIDREDVFVGGDLLWYPVEGDVKIRQAPDTLVAFGRPKGYRGSYMQWVEAGIAPKVVFEVLSPGNRLAEMTRKFKFYERYGVDEYYVYDPDGNILSGWRREGNELKEIPDLRNWVSPLLGIRFDTDAEPMVIYRPDGTRFLTFTEMAETSQRAEQELQRAEKEKNDAVQIARQQAAELEDLRARLKQLGG